MQRRKRPFEEGNPPYVQKWFDDEDIVIVIKTLKNDSISQGSKVEKLKKKWQNFMASGHYSEILKSQTYFSSIKNTTYLFAPNYSVRIEKNE